MNTIDLSTKISINPDCQLLIRGNHLLCGNLKTTAPPLPLQPLHLLLLNTFLKIKSVSEGVREFLQSERTIALTGQLPEKMVIARIQELLGKQILIQKNKQQSVCTTKTSKLETTESKAPVASFKGNYRVHKNLALHPKTEGFLACYSENYVDTIIDIDMLFTLFSVIQTEKIEDSLQYKAPSISQQLFWQNIEWLIEKRIIIGKKKVNDNCQTVSKEEKETSNAIPLWQSMQNTNKIPIYFVAHTQNHYPLALGLLHSAIEHYKDTDLRSRYQLIPITYMKPDAFLRGPYQKFGSGIWLFSNYLWSAESNLALSKFVKNDSIRNITIHGGPSTPDYPAMSEQFFHDNSSVDICVHGEGEIAICEILSEITGTKDNFKLNLDAMKMINGISLRDHSVPSSKVFHTESRTRVKDPNIIPSPYQHAVFDQYDNSVEAAIVETNRGCPFSCTFCDWGSAINQKVRKYDIDRVKKEIQWIAEKGTKVLWIADANFGMFERDIEIADFIIQMKKQHGFPQEVVVNYTKNTTEKLVEIIKIFTDGGIISQGVISIQTLDTQTLEVINRKNIKLDKYDELRTIFNEMKLPLSTDLMLGLPGSTIAGLKNDLQHYIDADVSVKAYPTQLLPNSPMADPEYVSKYKITTDANNYLTSSYSYTEQELSHMKFLYKVFTMADGYGLLRYIMRFMQWEYQVKAIDFISDLISNVQNHKAEYSLLNFAMNYFETDKSVPSGWSEFYQEVKAYLIHFYNVLDDTALETVLAVNKAAMPDEAITYPYRIELAHDFIEYFNSNSGSSAHNSRLSSYTMAEMNFNDSDGMVEIDETYLQYDSHQFFWELDSEIARTRSAFHI